MTVLNKAFSNCYYYIYTYEQPRLRQLAPIQTSNRRDVIHYTRTQDQEDSYSGVSIFWFSVVDSGTTASFGNYTAFRGDYR